MAGEDTYIVQMKASNGWSDKGFNELLQFLNDFFSKSQRVASKHVPS
jgi:hypothetical protein